MVGVISNDERITSNKRFLNSEHGQRNDDQNPGDRISGEITTFEMDLSAFLT